MYSENDPRRGQTVLRPRWWILYLIVSGAGAALWLVARTRMPAGDREVALIMLLLLVGALIEIWLSAHRRALLYWSPKEESEQTTYWNSFVVARRPVRTILDEAPVTGALLHGIEDEGDDGSRDLRPVPALIQARGK